MSRRKPAAETLAADLAALPKLSLPELKQRWEDQYGTVCPARMSRVLLVRALAYRIQEHAMGGLDRVTRRRLARVTEDLAAGKTHTTPTPRLKPGTRLLREWHGVVHEVIVLERGVEYRGKSWPSLSTVAREITGTRWSGPRFFGLKGGAQNGRG